MCITHNVFSVSLGRTKEFLGYLIVHAMEQIDPPKRVAKAQGAPKTTEPTKRKRLEGNIDDPKVNDVLKEAWNKKGHGKVVKPPGINFFY